MIICNYRDQPGVRVMILNFCNNYEKGKTIRVAAREGKIYLDDSIDITELLDKQTRININHTGKAIAIVKSETELYISSFFQYHVHSEYSLLDGISKLKDIAKVSSGITAVTDHGNMFAGLQWQNAMDKEGKKCVFGFEAYVETVAGEKKNNHLILLAKNEQGYKNLMKLTSDSFSNVYYKPHVRFDKLKEWHDGVICTSACLGGEIATLIKSDYEGAKRVAIEYQKIFGDDYYLEIQRHGIQGEAEINAAIIKLSKDLGIKLVCANDSHYIRKEDSFSQEAALCIASKKTLAEPHFKFTGAGYYYKSDSEMINEFWDLPEAIANTIDMAEKCTFRIKIGNYVLPKFNVPGEYKSETEYFCHLVEDGFKKRYEGTDKFASSIYRERLDYEKSVIISMGFPAYFLIVWDYVNFAKNNGILVGPGRGSVVGSLVAYCLEITELDPIDYGLLFERFLNPDRISMPDIDMDFEYRRRQEVINYCKSVYGEDCVCNISNFSTLKARVAVKDCARISGKSDLGNTISSIIGTNYNDLSTALAESTELKTMYDTDKDAKSIIQLALTLENNVRQTSTNACGVVITGEPIVNYIATSLMESNDEEYETKGQKYITTQGDKNVVEELHLLKMDFLGLRTLTVLEEGVRLANRDREKLGLLPFRGYEDITINDPYVYAEISEGTSFAVFQIESVGMRSFMVDLFGDVKDKIKQIEEKYNCSGYLDYFKGDEENREKYQEEMTAFGKELFERLIAGVSLYRPGPLDFIPQYIENMRHPENIKYDIPLLEASLKDTYGVIVYQEEVMRIVRDLAGFTSGQSDTIRKGMAKKKREILDEYREYFIYGSGDKIDSHTGKPFGIKGCVSNGIPEQAAINLWESMSKFAEYAFNKSHAAAYAVLSATCAYLKHYHPAGYICSMLNAYIDVPVKVKAYISIAGKMNINILPPDINQSADYFTVEDGCIRFGFGGIKGISKSAKVIPKDRMEYGDYKGVQDFVNRMIVKKVNKKAVEALVCCGCFDSFGKTRNGICISLDKIFKIAKNNSDISPDQLSFFDLGLIEGNDKTDDAISDIEEYPKRIKLNKELEFSGMFISENPLDQYRDILSRNRIEEIGLLSERDYNKKMTLCGIIKKVEIRPTKKDGRLMVNFILEDKSGELNCVLFPNDYVNYSTFISENEVRVVYGTYSNNDYGDQLICSSVTTPDRLAAESVQKKYCIYVNIHDDDSYMALREFAVNHPGTTPVYYQRDRQLFSLRIPVSDSSFIALQEEFGDKNVIYREKK